MDMKESGRTWRIPTVNDNLLDRAEKKDPDSNERLSQMAEILAEVLDELGVKVEIKGYAQGPAITRFDMVADKATKVKEIENLSMNLQTALNVAEVRTIAPVPGKSVISVEIPNDKVALVAVSELLDGEYYKDEDDQNKVLFAIGKGMGGRYEVSDVTRMPHLLISGATGSGKSVCINSLIMSVLYKYTPDEVKMIMVDPKVVELSAYNGIPHLLMDVVTDMEKAMDALRFLVEEMTRRYQKFEMERVREISGYNRKYPDKKMPRIILFIDELQDLMLSSGKEAEVLIAKLAQLSRACGIHLVISTQNPSGEVITSGIKTNMPSRISFAVNTMMESRAIIDNPGAEKLLGKGDMLFLAQGQRKPMRLQGGLVSNQDVLRTVAFWKAQAEGTFEEPAENTAEATVESSASQTAPADELYAKAVSYAVKYEKLSVGMLQRHFDIPFARANALMGLLCDKGVVEVEEKHSLHKVLLSPEDYMRGE